MAKTTRGTKADNRKKILAAARTLIAKNGVEKTSLAMISRHSEISKGTLYYYYASKAELVFDITDRHMDKITRDILKTDAPAPQSTEPGLDIPRFKALLEAYFKIILASRTRSRLHLYLIREAMAGNQELRKRFQATYAQWFTLIDQTQTRHLPPTPRIRL
ncbi:MAG: TetR/AcrR family transcriptional regulator, partial [Desulfobacterales bacterium]|nr:TetR/AcrR family transcriptional regulator [Desulfobacterales bacterium]